MSSNEEDYNDNENLQTAKKRKVQRACDVCRRKKIRCDGGQMPGNRCSNCIAYNFDCTYVEAAKKRGPPKGYVERLETRVEKLERVLTKLYPDSDILKEIDSFADTDAWLVEYLPRPTATSTSTSVPLVLQPRHPYEIATTVIRHVSQPVEFQVDADDFAHVVLADNMKDLHINDVDKNRFFGKSSGAMLVHAAMELKNEATGSSNDIRRPILACRRDEYWVLQPWERSTEIVPKASYTFPPPDLVRDLINLYFPNANLLLPVLHRPTFEKAVADELHLRDDGFAAVLLLVCAVGSHWSDDPRTLLDGVTAKTSAGWKWYQQVQQAKSSVLAPPSLYDLQYYCLSVMFLQGSCQPQQCWTLVGIGIRMAQDVGAHRKKHHQELTAEEELWKRGFWCLVAMDRTFSSGLGRPCAVQDEDFDLDFPVECDDEYWDHPDPSQRFKQPPNKPSYITGFVVFLKLYQVLTIILRTIYAINKSKIVLGFVGKQWEQHIVAELDSALNKWVDSIPEHLRWDPNRENVDHFQQSVAIYCQYYYIQILIHRSFIPSPRKPSPLSFPSLAICTNAARSCSHIIDVYRRRGFIATPQIQIAVFTAGVVLLLSLWNNKRSGMTSDPGKVMDDIHKCMQALRLFEERWSAAGRLWDIMFELASVGDLQLPNPSPPSYTNSNKRERDSDSPVGSGTLSSPLSTSTPITPEAPRAIAGSRRVVTKASQPHLTTSSSQPEHLHHPSYPLPVYSNELGRMPINGQASQQQPSAYWNPRAIPASGNTSGPPGPSPSSSYQTSMPPSSVPFGMDLYSRMGYGNGYTQAFAPSAPSSTQVPYGGLGNVGGGGGDPNRPIGQLAPSMPTGFGPDQFGTPGLALNSQEQLDSNVIAMWSNPPLGFELDDWGIYLSNVSELTHGMNQTTS